mgnify:CR=1 FL=1
MKIIELAVSLGGVQSLIEVAGAMTHPEKYITAADREEGGLSESLVRFRFVCWICMKIGQKLLQLSWVIFHCVDP